MDLVVSLISGILGVALVGWITWDVYQTVIVPRASPTRWRLTRFLIRGLWGLWRRRASRVDDSGRRERLLGGFAPLAVSLLIISWVALLIIGFGLILFALRYEIAGEFDFITALYQSGITVLTIGYGDVLALGLLSRAAEITAALSGIAILALGVTFLFSLYAAFQRREELVTTLDARAGAPPSGIAMLETYAQLELWDDLRRTFADWEEWSARVLDTHVAYPVLFFFRSSHDGESWLSAQGAVLDAAVLVATAVESGPRGQPVPRGQAIMTIKGGSHLVEDLSQLLGFESDETPMVTQQEFNAARYRLARAGMVIRADGEAAWGAFSELRSSYASRLNRMAAYLMIPPTQWIGDRSMLRHGDRVDEVFRAEAEGRRAAAALALSQMELPTIDYLDGEAPGARPAVPAVRSEAVASAADQGLGTSG